MTKIIPVFLTGILSLSVIGMECNSGKKAFQNTVFKKVTKDCAMCHDGSSQAPAFAVNDPDKSYYRILNYVSTTDLPKTTLVQRAGNSHCALSNCDADSGAEMLKLVEQWWQDGQNQCKTDSVFLTPEADLPNPLPTGNETFAVMTWNLDGVSQSLKGFQFSIEVKRFAAPTPQTPGAYLFRKPRLYGNGKAIRISNVKPYVNRVYDGLAASFTTIQTTLTPNAAGERASYPLLSSDSQIVVQATDADKISFGFGALEVVQAANCRAQDRFESTVLRQIEAEKCSRCHGGEGQAGTSPAVDFLSLKGSNTELCNRVLQRVSAKPENIRISPFVAMPVSGKLGHPKAVQDVPGFIGELKKWLELEVKARQ